MPGGDREHREHARHGGFVTGDGRERCTQESETTETDTSSHVPIREPPECDGTLEALPKMYDELEYDRLDEFELRVEPNTVALGEEISFTLRWVDGDDCRPPVVGDEEAFSIERETDDGWQSIYRIPEHGGWNALATAPPDAPPPTTWFDWSVTVTKQGMAQSSQFNTPYAVCEPLEPGPYRFVYWGVSPPAEEESDWETKYAIGVEFQVTE